MDIAWRNFAYLCKVPVSINCAMDFSRIERDARLIANDVVAAIRNEIQMIEDGRLDTRVNPLKVRMQSLMLSYHQAARTCNCKTIQLFYDEM